MADHRNDAQGDFPCFTLSNGDVSLTAFLPDADHGFYRGTRMDRSLMLDDIVVQGRRFFARNHPDTPHDPLGHDNVTGPAEEFDIFGPESYAEAPVGGVFLKIGVGVLRRVATADYGFMVPYPVVDPGLWHIASEAPRAVHVLHAAGLPDGSRAYRLHRRVSLPARGASLRIERAITNTGGLPITASHYNHNFIRFGMHDAGPGYTVEVPFRLEAPCPTPPPGVLNGTCLTWSEPITRSFYAVLGGQAQDDSTQHQFTVRHVAGGALRYATDAPLADFRVFATRHTVCPEPFTQLRVRPGETFRWNTEIMFEP